MPAPLPAVPGRPPAGPTWRRAWESALAELELEVTQAEAILALDHVAPATPAAWTPPAGLGPLPAELADRARAVLDRQVDVSRRLAEQMALSRRHQRAAEAMRASAPSVPVYLDLPA